MNWTFFYLGESLLFVRFADAIHYAKQDCGYPYIFLTTNGRMALLAKVKTSMAPSFDSLMFSYNFASSEQCKEVTSVDAFDQIVENT